VNKELLTERLQRLQARRQQVARQRAAELARIDEQITFTQGLLDNWDTFTIDEALQAAQRAGLDIKVERS
jgi:hypothetical protein